MEFAPLIIGVFLIVCGVILVFLKRDAVHAALVLVPGVIFCLVGVPGLSSATLNVLAIKTTITMKDVKEQVRDAKIDFKEEDIGPIKLEIQKINDALSKQNNFNITVTSSLNKLELSSVSGKPKIDQPNITALNPNFTANNKYSVIVFYKDSRAKDSIAVVNGLLAAGFQASSISTTLAETRIGPQPDNSTFIIPTNKGQTVAESVLQIVRQSLPTPRNDAVTLGAAYPLMRGDAQVFLF